MAESKGGTPQSRKIDIGAYSLSLAQRQLPLLGQPRGVALADPAIYVQGLSHAYRAGETVVDDVNFAVHKGEIFCLLGKNGAGKTTLLRILATQIAPSEGKVTVLGHDLVAEPWRIRGKIAVVPQGARPNMQLPAFENIYYMSVIRGLARDEARRRTAAVLKRLGLHEYRRKLVAELSGGLIQRVIVGMALTTEPEILFLDEPTVGVDPLGRRSMWDIIRRLSGEGVTIFLTTHYLDEADLLSSRLLILERGKALFVGTPNEAKTLAGQSIRIILGPRPDLDKEGEKELFAADPSEALEIVTQALREERPVRFLPPSLEEAFIKLVGKIDENAT